MVIESLLEEDHTHRVTLPVDSQVRPLIFFSLFCTQQIYSGDILNLSYTFSGKLYIKFVNLFSYKMLTVYGGKIHSAQQSYNSTHNHTTRYFYTLLHDLNLGFR